MSFLLAQWDELTHDRYVQLLDAVEVESYDFEAIKEEYLSE